MSLTDTQLVLLSAAAALSREPHRKRNLMEIHHRSCGSGRAIPLLRRLAPENAQRATGDKVALQVERGGDSGVAGEEALHYSLPSSYHMMRVLRRD
jgi:hypothetical protein